MAETKTRKGNSSKPANDYTGRMAEQLAQEHEAELREREKEMSMATPTNLLDQYEDIDGEVVDLTDGPNGAVVEPEVAFEHSSEMLQEEVGEAFHIIRTNETFSCTIGVHNNWAFEAGRKYKVPTHVWVYLEERGLIRH